jgi:chaperone modulatory protein CbpM
MNENRERLQAQVLTDAVWISAEEICRITSLSVTTLAELVDLGVVHPRGERPAAWELPVSVLPALQTAARLMADLELNVSGAAVAMELLERRRELERRVAQLERLLDELTTR